MRYLNGARRVIAVASVAVLVVACSDAGNGDGGGDVSAWASGGGTSAKADDWAKDACKTFPVDAAAKASGMVVKSSEGTHTNANDTDVASCTYSGEAWDDGFTVALRQAHDTDLSIDQQIAGVSSQPDITGPAADVAMPAGKAVWHAKMRTLTWVPDAARMIIVTPPGAITFGDKPPKISEADMQANAIRIAKAVEG